MSKIAFAERAKVVALLVAQAGAAARDLHAVWEARGYAAGGSDPIVDGDLVNTGETAAGLGDFNALCLELQHFIDGGVVAQGAWGAVAAVVRGDT